MQRLFPIILLFCLHAQPVVNLYVWIDFIANNSYIKDAFCINKETPELQCDGKCYLMQKLQESQSQQEQESPQLVHLEYEFVFLKNAITSTKTISIEVKHDNFPNDTNLFSNLYLLDIFHPPNV